MSSFGMPFCPQTRLKINFLELLDAILITNRLKPEILVWFLETIKKSEQLMSRELSAVRRFPLHSGDLNNEHLNNGSNRITNFYLSTFHMLGIQISTVFLKSL